MSSILIVASHLDDIEIGMGGTAQRLCEDNDVVTVTMTDGNPPTRDAHEERLRIFKQNASMIGFSNNHFLGYRSNYLTCVDSNECIARLNELISKYSPEIIYTQNSKDIYILPKKNKKCRKQLTLYKIAGQYLPLL